MDVNIQIKTVQSALDDPGVTPETVETNAVGTYRRDDEGDKLCYDLGINTTNAVIKELAPGIAGILK